MRKRGKELENLQLSSQLWVGISNTGNGFLGVHFGGGRSRGNIDKTIRIVCVIRECTIVPHFPDLGVCRSLGTVQYREVIVGTLPAAWPIVCKFVTVWAGFFE